MITQTLDIILYDQLNETDNTNIVPFLNCACFSQDMKWKIVHHPVCSTLLIKSIKNIAKSKMIFGTWGLNIKLHGSSLLHWLCETHVFQIYFRLLKHTLWYSATQTLLNTVISS